VNVVFATVTATVSLPDGSNAVVREGSHWPADDPVVRLQPSLFSTDPHHGISYSTPPLEDEAPLETATARPGEKRAAVRHRG